jgi:hypothetical protein
VNACSACFDLELRIPTLRSRNSSIHVLDRGIGHLIPSLDPQIVIAATKAVLTAVASGHLLAPCPQVFRSVTTTECLRRGQLGQQRT